MTDNDVCYMCGRPLPHLQDAPPADLETRKKSILAHRGCIIADHLAGWTEKSVDALMEHEREAT